MLLYYYFFSSKSIPNELCGTVIILGYEGDCEGTVYNTTTLPTTFSGPLNGTQQTFTQMNSRDLYTETVKAGAIGAGVFGTILFISLTIGCCILIKKYRNRDSQKASGGENKAMLPEGTPVNPSRSSTSGFL